MDWLRGSMRGFEAAMEQHMGSFGAIFIVPERLLLFIAGNFVLFFDQIFVDLSRFDWYTK